MRIVSKPEVKLVAFTSIDRSAMKEYVLSRYGTEGVIDLDEGEDGDLLVEFAGRLCYRSFKEGLNKNVVKVREGNEPYIGNILSSRHGSVTEHASATFLIYDASRVLTHELVRHRAGCAVSQESLRYVRLTDLDVSLPDWIASHPTVGPQAFALIRSMEDFQKFAAHEFKLDELTGKDGFAKKKVITSGLRRLAPIGVATTILWTANVRALRHVIELRTSIGAEEEIRQAFDQIADICLNLYPHLFQDFTKDAQGQRLPTHSKI